MLINRKILTYPSHYRRYPNVNHVKHKLKVQGITRIEACQNGDRRPNMCKIDEKRPKFNKLNKSNQI